MAFLPRDVLAVRREQGGPPWIIVRSDIDLPNYQATPLLVDVKDMSVSPLPDQWLTTERAHIDGISVYLYHLQSLKGNLGIHAIGTCRPPTCEVSFSSASHKDSDGVSGATR